MLSNPVYLRRLFRLSPSLSGIIARHSSRVMAKILPSVRPCVSTDEAVALAERFYGFRRSENVAVKELDSYDDRNFYLKGKLHENEEENEYVLKVMGTRDSYDPGFLDAVDQAMLHFSGQECGIQCPVPIQSLTGAYRHKIELKVSDPKKTFSALVNDSPSENNNHFKQLVSKDPLVSIRECKDGAVDYFMPHYVRLLSFVPGETLDKLEHINDDLFWECGVLVAKVQNAFKDIQHPSLQSRDCIWNLKFVPRLVFPYLASVRDQRKYSMIMEAIEEYKAIENLMCFSQQTIHADMNDRNLLVAPSSQPVQRGISNGISRHTGQDSATGKTSMARTSHVVLSGLLDFGNLSLTHRVYELSNCMTYMSMLSLTMPERAAALVLQGYKAMAKLSAEEERALPTLIKARLAQSLAIGHYKYSTSIEKNPYLLHTSRKGWHVLRHYQSMSNRAVLSMLTRDH